MSGGEGRLLPSHDIQLVQNCIKRCLQLYMSKNEVINALIIQDNVDPEFTELVWQGLEEENQEYFKAYYLKLLVKDQIMEFNRLLSEQVELMHRIGLSRVAPMVSSNGLHVSPIQHISTSSATQNAKPLKTEDTQRENVFHNCGSIMQSCMPRTVEGPIHNRKIEVSPSVFLSQNTNVELAQRNTNMELAQRNPNMELAQRNTNMELAQRNTNMELAQRNTNVELDQRNTNMELAQRNKNVELARRTNNKIVKAEAGYSGCSPFDFSPPGNYLESRPLMGDASVSSFSSVDSNAQHLNGTLLDGDTSPFGFLEQIPPSFNLPEMPADFTTSSDLLEIYCRPPFLAADTNNFMDPCGDVERLDPECESLRFPCFGGE